MDAELWKIVVNELLNREIIDIDPSLVSSLQDSVIKSMEWCSNPLIDQEVRMESCKKFYEIVETMLILLMRYRIVKALEGSEPRGFDKEIAKKVLELVDLFADVLLKGVKIFEGEVLCKVVKPIPLKNSIATPNYVTSIPIKDAVILSLLGFVKPIVLSLEYK